MADGIMRRNNEDRDLREVLKPGQLIIVGKSLMQVIRVHRRGVFWKRVGRAASMN